MLKPSSTDLLPVAAAATSIRVYHPARGWGEVTAARVPFTYQLHREGPSQLVWVEWDEGRGATSAGWYDPAYGPWTFRGASSLALLLRGRAWSWAQPELVS